MVTKPYSNAQVIIMYIQNFSVSNQQKIVTALDELNFKATAKWFSKFSHKENTIVKIQLSSIDIERIFKKSLFFKGDLTPENNVTYEECILEDVLNWNIFFPYQVSKMQLGHPIVLKRKLTYDNLHNVIYCFKGTLKAINKLMEFNSLPWSSKSNRTPLENKIINSMKYKRDINFEIAKQALINDEDYEIIDRIFDTEIMEELLEDEEVPFKSIISSRLTEFTQSQDQDTKTYLDDYIW